MVCTLSLISKNVAHGTGLPGPEGVCMTVEVGGSLVHTAGRYIRLHFYATTQKGTRVL